LEIIEKITILDADVIAKSEEKKEKSQVLNYQFFSLVTLRS